MRQEKTQSQERRLKELESVEEAERAEVDALRTRNVLLEAAARLRTSTESAASVKEVTSTMSRGTLSQAWAG